MTDSSPPGASSTAVTAPDVVAKVLPAKAPQGSSRDQRRHQGARHGPLCQPSGRGRYKEGSDCAGLRGGEEEEVDSAKKVSVFALPFDPTLMVHVLNKLSLVASTWGDGTEKKKKLNTDAKVPTSGGVAPARAHMRATPSRCLAGAAWGVAIKDTRARQVTLPTTVTTAPALVEPDSRGAAAQPQMESAPTAEQVAESAALVISQESGGAEGNTRPPVPQVDRVAASLVMRSTDTPASPPRRALALASYAPLIRLEAQDKA